MRRFSPYNYAFNNPIRFVDPDGMSPAWRPSVVNNKLTVVAEAGDNAKTLAKFLNVDQKRADKLFSSMKDGKVSLSNDIPGVEAINNAVSHTLKSPDSYGKGGLFAGFYQPTNYNCYESALSISSNETPNFTESRAPLNDDFSTALSESFTDVTGKTSQYSFGKTVLSFNDKSWNIIEGSIETPIHGATYLGTSKDGTVYTWSKSGWYVTPAIQTKKELEKDTYSSTDNVRFYNRKN